MKILVKMLLALLLTIGICAVAVLGGTIISIIFYFLFTLPIIGTIVKIIIDILGIVLLFVVGFCCYCFIDEKLFKNKVN